MAHSNPITPRPLSDVSGAVGLVGLAGLIAWLLVCHNWAMIATALDLAGPRQPMTGAFAALVALLASALPMAAWSLGVDRVHRRASTGIDWDHPHALSQTLPVSLAKLAGLWATWALIGFFYCLGRWYWAPPYRFAMGALGLAAVPLVLGSIPYVCWLDRRLVAPRDAAWHFGAALLGRDGWDREAVWRHARAWAVKGFFTAFMLSILPGGWNAVVGADWSAALYAPVPLANLLISAMFLIDVQIGTVGYLFTMRPLDAHIRSANPFLEGWLAALICYPPFALMVAGAPLDYHSFTADWSIWLAGHTALLWVWGAALVVLTGIYAWATLAFGLRFSNLTYRGVLTHGPYAWTRHPAYVSKNLFWWGASLPMLATTHSLVDAVRNCTVLALVNAVYFWRAKTEERHLAAADAKYVAYSEWMAEYGPITARLERAKHWLFGAPPAQAQLAE